MTFTISDWLDSSVNAPRPCFAIGDVHGECLRLALLHNRILRIVRDERLDNPLLVRLGDYIDRGPSSLGALRLIRMGLGGALEEVNLMGNHEHMLLGILDDHGARRLASYRVWSRHGGQAVLSEIGLDPTAPPPLDEVRARLVAALGLEGLAALRGLKIAHRCGDLLFVHAGIHPRMPLARFLEATPAGVPRDQDVHPLWIRYPFLEHEGPFEDGVFVVHGHTPTFFGRPELCQNRLGIDTGAYRGGPLSAVEFRGRRCRFIQVWPPGSTPPPEFHAFFAQVKQG